MIAKNIKFLRKKYNETQPELAKQLYIVQSRISDFEKGKPVPEEIIKNIARHYRVTEHDLKYTDLAEYESITEIPKKELIFNMLKYLFPIIMTPQAIEDEDFKKGYDLYFDLTEGAQKGEKIEISDLKNILISFRTAWKRNKVLPAIANYVGIILFITATFNEREDALVNAIISERDLDYLEVKKLYLRQMSNNNELKEIEKDRQEFFEDHEETVMSYIKILKETSDYYDLADYYLAIMHFVGFVESELDCQTNQRVAINILNQLCKIENKYAIQFASLFI